MAYNPSRRTMLGCVPAAGLALTVVGAAITIAAANGADADAELLALGAEFEKAWDAERETFQRFEDIDSDEADEATETAVNAVSVIADKIEKLQAHTLAGLKLKARVITWCRGDDELSDTSFNDQGTTDVRFAASIVRDLLKL
jgi:hypothetical protein